MEEGREAAIPVAGRQRPGARHTGPVRLTVTLVLGWLLLVLLLEPVDFVIFDPEAKTGFEMFLALGQLFGALVIALSTGVSDDARRPWIAASMFALGFGALTFGYLLPAVDEQPGADASVGQALFVRTTGMLLLAIGLVPRRPPRLSRRGLVALLAAGGIASVAFVATDLLPALVSPDVPLPVVTEGEWGGFPGLTRSYIALNLLPVMAGLAALWSAARGHAESTLEAWVVVAVVLLVGVQVHASFWPSIYGSVLTTTSLLRLALTLVIVFGGILSLRDLAQERARLLASERQRVRRLEDYGRLTRDFSSMVAHELSTPLAAVSTLARMIGSGAVPPDAAARAAGQIEAEARVMGLLVRDIQESAEVERPGFAVDPRPVPIATLVEEAATYARVLAEGHPLTIDAPATGVVLADPERISQVLRNLIANAARHTPSGTPITIHAHSAGSRVRIAIADSGPGIEPADRDILLEKFMRGRNAKGNGHGLGLYLSHRILRAHGSGLAVESTPGEGARFSFDLERPV